MSDKKIHGQNAGQIALGEALREYDLEATDATEGYADAVNPRTGAEYQVKGTVVRYSDGNRGRFRVWQEDHRPNDLSWYVFVIYDRDGNVLAERRVKPATVTKLCESRWSNAQHRRKDGNDTQAKIVWSHLFDPSEIEG